MHIGDIIGALTKRLGPTVYENCREVIKTLMDMELKSVLSAGEDLDNSKHLMETDEDEQVPVPPIPTFGNHGNSSSSFPPSSFDKITVFEASPKGVRSSKLETILKCLINVVNALGAQFKTYVDEEYVGTILNTLQHPNRFVREAGFLLCSVLLDSGKMHTCTYANYICMHIVALFKPYFVKQSQ